MYKQVIQEYQYPDYYDEETCEDLFVATAKRPLEFFCPTGKQEQTINLVANSTKDSKVPVILLTAANGIGKTTFSIHTCCNFILGSQNGWYDYPIFQKFPFPKLIWYISTAEALKNTIVPEFQHLLPKGKYTENKEGKPHVATITCNGWTIGFKTFDQDVKTFESANVGIIVIDEPAPEPIWKAVKSRRRKGCITMLPLTPLFTPPYLMDEIKAAVDSGRKGYYHLTADVYSACKNRGIRGHLDPDIIDDMVADYDEDEREARAEGKFAYFSNRIYTRLNAKIHKVHPEEYPIPDGSVIKLIADPHDSRSFACAYMALTPSGRHIFFAETPEDKSTNYWNIKKTELLATEIQWWIDIENRFAETLKKCTMTRVMDKYFGWQSRNRKTIAETVLEESIKLGKRFVFNKSYSSNAEGGEIHYGHVQVRNALQPMADGKPGLVVWNTCFHIWEGLTHYVRKHETSKSSEDKAAGEGKIIEKYKDFPDVVRYGVCDPIKPAFMQPEIPPLDRRLERLKKRYAEQRGHRERSYLNT